MGLLNSGEATGGASSVGVVAPASFFGDSGIEIVTVAAVASCCLVATVAAAAAVVLLGVVEGEVFWRQIQLCFSINSVLLTLIMELSCDNLML